MKIGNAYFQAGFTILDQNHGMDFLLGLDMLKKHQMCIDLKKNALVMDSDAVPFLVEHEIPAFLTNDERLDLSGPRPPLEDSPASHANNNSATTTATTTVKPWSSSSSSPAAAAAAATTTTTTNQLQPALPPSSAKPWSPNLPTPLQQQSQQNDAEMKIAQLMALGFARQQCVEALQVAGGNVDAAAGVLFQLQ